MCDGDLDSDNIPPAVIWLVSCRNHIWDHVVIPVVQEEDSIVQNICDQSDVSAFRTQAQESNSVFITEKFVPVLSFRLNAYVAAAFRTELVRSQTYRKFVWDHLNTKLYKNSSPLIVAQIKLQYPKKEVLDYKFCTEVQRQVYERIEMEYIMSWLSTLGGAFSSLGDQFVHCAETAGRISVQQFKIALKLGDPATLTRCQLYLSVSLIQRKRLKEARNLIQILYKQVKSQPDDLQDKKLISMCLGIWSKLRYEWQKQRSHNKKCIVAS